jgi:hypothetical protein
MLHSQSARFESTLDEIRTGSARCPNPECGRPIKETYDDRYGSFMAFAEFGNRVFVSCRHCALQWEIGLTRRTIQLDLDPPVTDEERTALLNALRPLRSRVGIELRRSLSSISGTVAEVSVPMDLPDPELKMSIAELGSFSFTLGDDAAASLIRRVLGALGDERDDRKTESRAVGDAHSQGRGFQ